MKRLDQLTFTRFWALLLVIIYHGGGGIYTNWMMGSAPIAAILMSAPTAVSYLYVLSGFVMSLVYYRPNDKFDISSYWTARFVRIYPLYIISFLLVCYYYIDYMANIKPPKILANIFVIQAWWPTYAQSFNYASWSMTVEFFFYAVFPFFTLWAYRQSTRKLIWISLGLWLFTQIVHFILWIGYFPAWYEFVVYNPIFHLNSFIMGVVGGIWFVRHPAEEGEKTSQTRNFLLILLSLGLIAGYTVVSVLYPGLPHDLEPMAGLLAPFFVLFIVTLALDKTRLSSVLSHRWLVILGETAFALYILHVPVIWIYERALFSSDISNPEYIMSITYMPLMITVGLVAYLFIDPPIRNWMKNILKRVSMPLLVLDLVIFGLSAYLTYHFRFEGRRELLAYENTMLVLFWSAFLWRTAISIAWNSLDPASLYVPIPKLVRLVFLSVTTGSVVVAFMVYLGFLAGWYENFPRSIFVIDWIIVFGLSLLIRFAFRALHLYKNKPVLI